ncbi:MAG: rRNA pseudouridine synthase [Clostridia bacterium]|jgi:23S rRNA pseudouridine2605 synthase|nr:rRNA pseudouridine synthase [Clostridia bacterium]MBQ9919945.1 rRNA pseudouridine synthase [Clostridia bacterium]
MKDNRIRLQKYMSENGIASRRKSEEMIEAGKVKVNGRVATLGDKVDPIRDKIVVSGKRVVRTKTKMYIMLHKPRGFVTTMSDELGRKCVSELVEDAGVRLFPVGRLDRNSEGLLLMTNDGAFSNMLTHPSRHVSKVYRVTVREKVTEDQLIKLTEGIMLDGTKTLPCDVHIIDKGENRTVLNIVLYEGRNRQIRRMCEAVGLTVIRLKRTEIAGVRLGMLPQGKWRELNEKEMQHLTNVSVAKRNED